MIFDTTLAWIRCTLSFSLLRLAVMCIHGSQSVSYQFIIAADSLRD